MKTIGIMGAMPEEIDPLLELLGDFEKEKYAKNTYYKAKYKNLNLVIAYSKIGKVNAALTANTLIEKYKATKLLFSGVAGAINKDFRIADLMYANKLAQHDLDITVFGHPHGYVPEGAVFVESDKKLNQIAQKVAKNQHIQLHSGIVATGDQFISNEIKKEWIKKIFNADAIEMEGAAVAVVCDALNVPFFILRSISDGAGMDAEFDFDKFLKSSAIVSAKFLYKMLDFINDEEKA